MSAGNDLLQFKTVTTTNYYIKSSLKLLPSLVQLAFLLNAYHLRLSIILEFSFNNKLATELVFFLRSSEADYKTGRYKVFLLSVMLCQIKK